MNVFKMEALKDAKDTTEALLNDVQDRNAKLHSVLNLKKLFQSPDRILSKLKLETLLQSARVSLENKTPEKDFLYSYGTSLVGFIIGRDSSLDSEIIHQLEYILEKLKEKDESLADELVGNLWNQLEKGFGTHPDGVLDASKHTIERTVLEWLETSDNPRMEFISRMCADSPKLFQSITSVLYEVLVRTKGSKKVFEVISSFIESVKRECRKKGKSFLGMYPKGTGQLVSLLRLPPDLCLDGSGDVAKEVVSLLLEMFLTDRKKALILLSHYTKWLPIFRIHLENSDF